MQIDRQRVSSAFSQLANGYDASNPKIRLKEQHTVRVAALCERIARSAGLTDADVDLAWLCGVLHDVGRFEQIRRYGTFSDAASESHAKLGERMLFEEGRGFWAGPGRVSVPASNMTSALSSAAASVLRQGPLIRAFIEDDSEDELIRAAVSHHSDYRLPQDLDGRTQAFCDILRDADKLDILRVNCEDSVETIYGVDEATMRASAVSPNVVEAFYQHRTLRREERHFWADYVVGHICFAFELVYPESRRIARQQGYVFRMLERPFDNADTQAIFRAMDNHMRAWLQGPAG